MTCREWVIRSSFPALLHEVRAEVVRHLFIGDDTLYGIAKAIGRPIQSVTKAVDALARRGYVECGRSASWRRRINANVCGLTDLGLLAAMALSGDLKAETAYALVMLNAEEVYRRLPGEVSLTSLLVKLEEEASALLSRYPMLRGPCEEG